MLRIGVRGSKGPLRPLTELEMVSKLSHTNIFVFLFIHLTLVQFSCCISKPSLASLGPTSSIKNLSLGSSTSKLLNPYGRVKNRFFFNLSAFFTLTQFTKICRDNIFIDFFHLLNEYTQKLLLLLFLFSKVASILEQNYMHLSKTRTIKSHRQHIIT